MNKELTVKLVNDFPELYKGVYKSPRESCMAFGFECGDGWFELLYNLSEQIQLAEGGTKVVASQVKEKFGTLRFYIDSGSDEVYSIIDSAEEQSAHICDVCGHDGTLGGDGWMRTRCEEHK